MFALTLQRGSYNVVAFTTDWYWQSRLQTTYLILHIHHTGFQKKKRKRTTTF